MPQHPYRREERDPWKNRRRDVGVCFDCGNPAEEGKVRCAACLAKQALRSAAYRAQRAARDDAEEKGRDARESGMETGLSTKY